MEWFEGKLISLFRQIYHVECKDIGFSSPIPKPAKRKQRCRKSPGMLCFARRPKARLDSPPRPRRWRRSGEARRHPFGDWCISNCKTLQRNAPTQLKRATQAPPSLRFPHTLKSSTGAQRGGTRWMRFKTNRLKGL